MFKISDKNQTVNYDLIWFQSNYLKFSNICHHQVTYLLDCSWSLYVGPLTMTRQVLDEHNSLTTAQTTNDTNRVSQKTVENNGDFWVRWKLFNLIRNFRQWMAHCLICFDSKWKKTQFAQHYNSTTSRIATRTQLSQQRRELTDLLVILTTTTTVWLNETPDHQTTQRPDAAATWRAADELHHVACIDALWCHVFSNTRLQQKLFYHWTEKSCERLSIRSWQSAW